jgi:predicted lipoprotein with Yx(FWY)xxD motif
MSRTRFPLVAVAVLAAAVVAVVVATSGASTKKAPQNVAAGSAISLRKTSLGSILADANGRTLYLFESDTRNVSSLSAAGRAVWPPFTASTKPQALGGAVAGQIGTIAQAGPSPQITYDGHPLYYYFGDQGAGQTRGQGLNQFGALWYALSSSGTAVTSQPSSSTPTAPSSGAAGYGY